jgi:hypothetical protein
MQSSRRNALLLCAAVLLPLAACEHSTPTVPIQPSVSSPSVTRWTPDSAQMATLARGLALALQSPAVRTQILEDLRDSPFEGHAIEFGSYLRGTRGQRLLTAMAGALRMDPEMVMAMAGDVSGAGVELRMPRYGDRRTWTGDAKVAVIASAVPLASLVAARDSVDGLDPTGQRVSVFLRGAGPIPYLSIHPSRVKFGSDAESVRANAPRRRVRSIGREDELLGSPMGGHRLAPSQGPSRMVPCEEPDCSGGGGGGGSTGSNPGYLNLPSNRNYDECVNPSAADPVDAGCKAELAWAFRPRLVFNWDEDCKTREPYWTMNRTVTAGELEIFYALSYWRDCGNRRGTADSHWGDSEFIIVRVSGMTSSMIEYYPRNWRLNSVTLSAHYGWVIDDTWSGDWPAVEFRAGESRQRPVVYVSWGKHGNYRDVGSCGRGGSGFDDCGRYSDVGEEFGFANGSAQDLGSRAVPRLDCVPSRLDASKPGLECYWTNNPPYDNFSGWTLANPYSTAYNPILSGFGF